MMNEQDRLGYLRALGIDVWKERGAADADEASSSPERAAPVSGADEVVNAGTEPVSSPPESAVSSLDWGALEDRVSTCTACQLHATRTQTVFGVGNTNADWMIIGEAPGQEEDRRGEPFVGRAGQLLDQMLLALGLDRKSVYIANTLKCRPPNNRDPSVEEASACRPFLERQIALIQPRVVVAVGRIAAQKLIGTDAPLGRLRGQVHFLQNGTLPLVVTYHPAYLLRSPSQKGKAWRDLCLASSLMEENSG